MKRATAKVFTIVVGLGLLGSCEVQRAARPESVTPERATECVDVCRRMGLHLSAVVVMMSSAGCVCEPNAGQPAAAAGGASAAAGGTTIAAAQAAASSQAAAAAAMQMQMQQQQQHQLYH